MQTPSTLSSSWSPALCPPSRARIYFPTRFNSAVSAFSASASITPPHSVMPLRNDDALFRRIEPLQRRMQQKRLAVVLRAVAGLRDHEKSGFKLTIASSEAKPPKSTPRSPAALASPASAEQRADKTVAARHPAAPRQRQHAKCRSDDRAARARPSPHRAARFRPPRDRDGRRCRRSRGSGPCLVKVARHRQFGEMKPVRLQQLARRALVERAGDDDVGLEHQNVLGAAGQHRIAADSPAATPAVPRQTGSIPGSARDRPAPAASDRCRCSSRRCAAPAADAALAGNASTMLATSRAAAVASDFRPGHDHRLALVFRAIGADPEHVCHHLFRQRLCRRALRHQPPFRSTST